MRQFDHRYHPAHGRYKRHEKVHVFLTVDSAARMLDAGLHGSQGMGRTLVNYATKNRVNGTELDY